MKQQNGQNRAETRPKGKRQGWRKRYRRVRKHRTYEVAEVARVLGVQSCTVRRWCSEGLPVQTDQKPHLITGADLKQFLRSRARDSKRPCQPGEVWCPSCRKPQKILAGTSRLVDTESFNPTIKANCTQCGRTVCQFVAASKAPFKLAELEATATRPKRLDGSAHQVTNAQIERV